MSLRVWAPRRSPPASAAGTFVSVAAHAALAALVAGAGPARAARDSGTAPRAAPGHGGERLHWVGVGDGSARGAAPRPGAPPPVAYVVPGRGGLRYDAPPAARSRGRAPVRAAAGDPGPGAPGVPGELPPPMRPAESRTHSLARRAPIPAIPTVAVPDAEATFLVAGVLSAAPDLTRQVTRPEDFLPPAPEPVPELRARPGARPLALLGPSARVDDLPVPLVSNPPPAYPTMLERARVGGRVVVEFKIDSTGAVDLGSLKVVQSTNRLFTQAVRRVLPRLRFLPAHLGARAVAVTVRQPFEFRVASGL